MTIGIYVHGTDAASVFLWSGTQKGDLKVWQWKEKDRKKKDAFYALIEGDGTEKAYRFEWNGGATDHDRIDAGKRLGIFLSKIVEVCNWGRSQLEELGSYEGQSEIVLISQSHGGNVIATAMDYVPNRSIRAAYLFACPVMEKTWTKERQKKVCELVTFSHPSDNIQGAGAKARNGVNRLLSWGTTSGKVTGGTYNFDTVDNIVITPGTRFISGHSSMNSAEAWTLARQKLNELQSERRATLGSTDRPSYLDDFNDDSIRGLNPNNENDRKKLINGLESFEIQRRLRELGFML